MVFSYCNPFNLINNDLSVRLTYQLPCSVESSEIDLSEFQEETNGGGDGDNNVDNRPHEVDAEPRNGATEPTSGNGGEILTIIFTVIYATFL